MCDASLSSRERDRQLARFLRAGREYRRYIHHRRCGEKLRKQVLALLGQRVDTMLVVAESDTEYEFEIPLATYLVLWPDARPIQKIYGEGDQCRGYLQYPVQHVGAIDGMAITVSAQTAAVEMKA